MDNPPQGQGKSMSFDIDMKNFSGATEDLAAVDQSDANFYQKEVEEVAYGNEPVGEIEKEIPKESVQSQNFKALREEVDRLKAEREAEKRDYQVQLEMMKANMAPQKQPVAQENPKKFLDGMEEFDVPNVGEIRREWEKRESAYQAKLEELELQQRFPDYVEVIEKHTLPLMQQKPHLAQGIYGANNKALYAYELGKMAQQMQQSNQSAVAPPVSSTAQRIVENSKKPGTLSQTGGQAVLGKADYYASMSDQEFMQMANKYLEGI